jgi:hypothetical protein
MLEFRWLLEELRVSFFAQELRTPQPVSMRACCACLFLNAKSLRCTVYENAPDEFFRCVSCCGGIDRVDGFAPTIF